MMYQVKLVNFHRFWMIFDEYSETKPGVNQTGNESGDSCAAAFLGAKGVKPLSDSSHIFYC